MGIETIAVVLLVVAAIFIGQGIAKARRRDQAGRPPSDPTTSSENKQP